MSPIQTIKDFLLTYQKNFCKTMSALDGQKNFYMDHWQRDASSPLEGHGISAVIQEGNVFEKGGINFSLVSGQSLPASATAHRPDLAGVPFSALGVSIVMHPQNPYVPTSHANVRYFQTTPKDQEPIFWFGGGFDLTPYYAFEEDCVYWHKMAKAACDPFGAELYPEFKKWADDYFYLKHRGEHRGIGGIFYDDLTNWPFAKGFEFMQSVAQHYLQAYAAIVEKRKNTAYGDREKQFQLLRRGRYVEFNLLYDRGTLFGLQSGGRTESILMSLPAQVNWQYAWEPEKNSQEAKLTEYFLRPRDWLAYNN